MNFGILVDMHGEPVYSFFFEKNISLPVFHFVG